jgi:hypothetical protein
VEATVSMKTAPDWIQILGAISPIVLGVLTVIFGWLNSRPKTLGEREGALRDDLMDERKNLKTENEMWRAKYEAILLEKTQWLIDKANLERDKRDFERRFEQLEKEGKGG